LPVVAVAAGTRIARHSTGRWLGGFVGGFVVLLVVVFMATMAATSGVVATHVGPAGQFLPNAKTGLAPDEQAQAARALGVADEVKAPPLAVLAMVCAALGESHFHAIPNRKDSGYAGVFQADPSNIPMDDTEEQARSFLLGGKGFQAGGAIFLATKHPAWGPGLIATLVEASGEAPEYYGQYIDKARRIISAWRDGAGAFPTAIDDATVAQVLGSPGVLLTVVQKADLASGGIDGRIVSILSWMGDAHRVEVTALRHDHGTYTVEGNRSNHADGRAMDIGAVDGHPCIETWGAPPDWGSACGRMVRALTRLSAPLRPTELIYCWDPDGPSDSRGFARSDHCNHIHVGFDAG
jgi:hypothetical protein